MKNLFALGAMILVFISCEKDNSTKVELSNDYFPLKVGNYWNFEHVGKYIVSETQMVNGVEYFKIATDYNTTMLYRNHDNKIFTKESSLDTVSYTHLRAHETDSYLVCRLLLEKKKN